MTSEMWNLYRFGILFVILISYRRIYARVLPELPASNESIESTSATNSFLDQISATKLECLLQFVENPGANLQCIDKHFGDDRSQFLLGELRSELAGSSTPEEEIEADDVQDKVNEDRLAADLNTLSAKTGPISTVNDDIAIIDSDVQKRVDEAVNTPKKEQQRNAMGESIPEVTAEVVKSNDGDEATQDNQIVNQDGDEYEYDSSLVAKLYNVLQDLVVKETFDYGLKMNEDDNDSEEDKEDEQTQNLDENTTAAKHPYAIEENGSNSEEEEQETDKYANDEDELVNELKQMQGGNDDDSEEHSDEQQDIGEIENDLVKELDKMLQMAKQAIADKDKKEAPDQLLSSDKFLGDLQRMEKALKDSTS